MNNDALVELLQWEQTMARADQRVIRGPVARRGSTREKAAHAPGGRPHHLYQGRRRIDETRPVRRPLPGRVGNALLLNGKHDDALKILANRQKTPLLSIC